MHELKEALVSLYERNGTHKAASDPERAVAVLHDEDALSYRDLVAAMGALHGLPPAGRSRGLHSFPQRDAVEGHDLSKACDVM